MVDDLGALEDDNRISVIKQSSLWDKEKGQVSFLEKGVLTYPRGRKHEPDDECALEGVVEWEPAGLCEMASVLVEIWAYMERARWRVRGKQHRSETLPDQEVLVKYGSERGRSILVAVF